MELFEEMPRLEGEHVIVREMVASDAPALEQLAAEQEVYRYLPTFLFEQQYDDKRVAIESIRPEYFETHQSILLAVCFRETPDQMVGIAEIYNYHAEERKVSVGLRLLSDWWNCGIATETSMLLKEYLIERVQLNTITAHTMVENEFSGRVLTKTGFEKCGCNLLEDWGRDEPVLADKYVFYRNSAAKADS